MADANNLGGGQTTPVTPEQMPQQLSGKLGKGDQKTLLQLALNPPPPPSALQVEQPQIPEDPTAKQELVENTKRHLMRMLNFRRQYDAKRSTLYRQFISQKDQSFFPDRVTKRSNTFVPYPQMNVEAITARTMDAFFSYEDWFECKPRGENDQDAAEKMQMVLAQKLRKARFPHVFQDVVRNIAIYGHGAIKVDWDWDFDIVNYAEPIPLMQPGPNGQPAPVLNPMTGRPLIIGYKPARRPVARNRPKFYAIDIYDLLVDPDGGITAHLTERTLGQMKRELMMNPNLYDPQGMQELEAKIVASEPKAPEEVIVRMAEFWNEFDGTRTLMTFGDDKEAISWKDLRFAMRSGNSYSSFRRKVFAGSSILLYHGENPFIHKKAPILHTSYIKLPNEVYGLGAVEIIAQLSESLNMFVNMITDNWNVGINRRYAYDTNADIDHEALNAANTPGGKVGVSGDPSKVLLPLPFFTPQSGDYALLESYKTMIEMTSGVSDFYHQGVGSSGGNDTATGINSVINESDFRFKMFIRNLELDILQPLLEMCANLVQQYVTDQEEVTITDTPAGIPKFYQIQPEELLGSMDFDLVAANYATNKIVRQRNTLAFAQLAGQSQFVDEYQALKELGKVFEVRNINKILKTPDEVAAEQQAALQQQIQMMILEAMLQTESKARLSQSKPQPVGQGKGGGAPRTKHFEGKIPGAGLESSIREFAQNMGGNALGLENLTGAKK